MAGEVGGGVENAAPRVIDQDERALLGPVHGFLHQFLRHQATARDGNGLEFLTGADVEDMKRGIPEEGLEFGGCREKLLVLLMSLVDLREHDLRVESSIAGADL